MLQEAAENMNNDQLRLNTPAKKLPQYIAALAGKRICKIFFDEITQYFFCFIFS